jgi:Fe-S-cluster containining protein
MNPCQGCAADCCRHFQVVVLGWDVYRLSRDLGLPPESFIELQGAAEPDRSHQLVLDVEARERRYHRLALKKERGGCVFLLSLDGKGRCGVYHSRPQACRTYPALIGDSDLLTLTKREHCPPGAWDDLDEAVYRPRYRTGQKQRAIFEVVGDGWNERVLRRRERRSPSELLTFLMSTYGALEATRPEWFDDARPEEVAEEELREQVNSLLVQNGWLLGT